MPYLLATFMSMSALTAKGIRPLAGLDMTHPGDVAVIAVDRQPQQLNTAFHQPGVDLGKGDGLGVGRCRVDRCEQSTSHLPP